ncbi:MAG: signal peptide peptidase SppA [Prochlorothrix sp.]
MRDFFKTVFATVLGLFLFMGLSIGGLLVLLIAFASTVQREEEVVVLEEETLLVYDLATLVTDRPLPTGLFEFSFGDFEDFSALSLRSLRQALEVAATDENIKGLYLLGNNFPPNAGGYAALTEIRAAIQDFQEASGKPVWAYGVGWSEPEYYLVSGADALWMNPVGDLSLDGFSTEIQFYAGALEKYGIGMQVIRAGRYKSAVEPFTEQQLSEANREQSLSLITDLWQTVTTTVAEGRDLQPDQIRALAQERGVLMPTAAVETGLVDALKHEDEMATELRSLMGIEDPLEDIPKMSLSNYAFQVETGQIGELPSESENRIALVYAEGEVVGGGGSRGVIASEDYVSLLRELRLDEAVQAVVLRINSPGGSATAAALIGREVELLAEAKPVMVSMGDVAASGGYWIAAPADRIFAEANTITGSIGVFGLLPNFQEFANNNGVTWDGVSTGPYANLDTVARPKTEAELALFQGFVDEIYDRFLDVVATGRSLPRTEVEEIAQGRVWSGTAAQRVKLVDEIGGVEQAIAAAAAAAELGDWTVDEYPTQPSLEEAVLGRLFSDGQLWSQDREFGAIGALFPISPIFPRSLFSDAPSPAQLSLPTQLLDPAFPSPVLPGQSLNPALADLIQDLGHDWHLLMHLNDPRHTYSRLPIRFDLR